MLPCRAGESGRGGFRSGRTRALPDMLDAHLAADAEAALGLAGKVDTLELGQGAPIVRDVDVPGVFVQGIELGQLGYRELFLQALISK